MESDASSTGDVNCPSDSGGSLLLRELKQRCGTSLTSRDNRNKVRSDSSAERDGGRLALNESSRSVDNRLSDNGSSQAQTEES